MPILNAGAGSNRPPAPWVNLDNLHSQLAPGTPERANLDAEPNYVDWSLGHSPMPFQPDTFEGALYSHVVEHMDVQQAVRALDDARRILMPGGILVVSVPDAAYFRKVHAIDTRAAAEQLFGEPIHDERPQTFFHYALLFHQHLQIFTEDSLWAVLRGAGFDDSLISRLDPDAPSGNGTLETIRAVLNRKKFSLVMLATKR